MNKYKTVMFVDEQVKLDVSISLLEKYEVVKFIDDNIELDVNINTKQNSHL